MTDKHDSRTPQDDTGGRLISSNASEQIPQFDRIQAVIQPVITTCYQLWSDKSDVTQQMFTGYLIQSVALAHQQFSMSGQTTPPDNGSIPQWQTIQPVFQMALTRCHAIWSASETNLTNQQFLSLLMNGFLSIGKRYWQTRQNS